MPPVSVNDLIVAKESLKDYPIYDVCLETAFFHGFGKSLGRPILIQLLSVIVPHSFHIFIFQKIFCGSMLERIVFSDFFVSGRKFDGMILAFQIFLSFFETDIFLWRLSLLFFLRIFKLWLRTIAQHVISIFIFWGLRPISRHFSLKWYYLHPFSELEQSLMALKVAIHMEAE